MVQERDGLLRSIEFFRTQSRDKAVIWEQKLRTSDDALRVAREGQEKLVKETFEAKTELDRLRGQATVATENGEMLQKLLNKATERLSAFEGQKTLSEISAQEMEEREAELAAAQTESQALRAQLDEEKGRADDLAAAQVLFYIHFASSNEHLPLLRPCAGICR